jgi:hypothetical protein
MKTLLKKYVLFWKVKLVSKMKRHIPGWKSIPGKKDLK